MKPQKLTPTKNKAQAMAEFAIALPILLMLLYGLLETGRLLFIYSSVTNASRQAARWGSTSGNGDGGIPGNNSGVPRYQDCAGIKASAQRGDFLNAFDNEDITITYDMGPGVTNNLPDKICNGSSDTGIVLPTGTTANTARIYVVIDADFTAIVPKLVPFLNRTVANGNPIKATSARTIITSITIEPPKESTTITITADVPDPSDIGQDVVVSFTVTGDTTIPTGIVNITGADTNCSKTLDSNGMGSCIVNFASFGDKTITATYVGDPKHVVSSDTENHTVRAPTQTTITVHIPNPSKVNETVNVSFEVTSAWGIPTGAVNITGADVNCSATLDAAGKGSCSVIFTSSGSKTLTATYIGDAQHKGSFGTAAHTVEVPTPTVGPAPTNTKTSTPGPAPTQTFTSTPVPAACDVKYTIVNQWNNGFQADVTIKNNSSTAMNGWTVAWSYTAGQVITNYWNTNLTQNGGAVTASNLSWNANINPNGGTQNFGFQGSYSGTNPSPASFTVNGQPCTGGAAAPTATLTPSLTPTTIPTGVSCTLLSHQPIVISGNTMSMIINNNSGIALAIQNVTVTWNHDRGRVGNGGSPTGRALQLNNSAYNSVIYWSGTQNGPSYTITPSSSINIPTGSSTISFKFDFEYFNIDGSERIYINISTPGCGFLDSNS